MSAEQSLPVMPPVPAGPWRRWDGTEMVVVCVAQSPIDGGWHVVYVPRAGKGWEVYVEPLASWTSEAKPNVPKYTPTPGGPPEATLAREAKRNGNGKNEKRVLLSTITCGYAAPKDDQGAVQMNGQAGVSLGNAIVSTLAGNAEKLRGNVLVSLLIQATADGEELGSNIVIAPADALPKDPPSRLIR